MQAPQKAAQAETIKVKVLRPFYYKGKPVEKNETVELPRVFALEMRDAKKAVLIVEAAEQPAAPVAQASEKKADVGKKEK